jgi:hypothetical protein
MEEQSMAATDVESPLMVTGHTAEADRESSRRGSFRPKFFVAALGVGFVCLGAMACKRAVRDGNQPEASVDGVISKAVDAVPFTNIDKAMSGYNVYYSDPAPAYKAGTVNQDPGLRKPVFDMTYSQGQMTADHRHSVPDGYSATVDEGCSTVFTTKSIENEYDYLTESIREASIGLIVEARVGVTFPPSKDKKASKGVSASITAGVHGTMSMTANELRNQNTFRSQRIERSTAKCSSYVAALNYGQPPPTHPDFKNAIKRLGDIDHSPQPWINLFDDYGTHFLTTIKMGARYVVSSYFDKSKFQKMKTDLHGIGLSVGAVATASAGISVTGKKGGQTDAGITKEVQTSYDLLSPKEKSGVDTVEGMMEKQSISAVGAPLTEGGVENWLKQVGENPVPVRFETREICFHPAMTGNLPERCQKVLKNYCLYRLAGQGFNCQAVEKRECEYNLDCEEGFACRDFKCQKIPVCMVTMCDNHLHNCGDRYRFPFVDAETSPYGKVFHLDLNGWNRRISALSLSDGCREVELVKDGGRCQLGSGHNGWFKQSVNLQWGLNDYSCKIKIWAKALPKHPEDNDDHMYDDDRRLRAANLTDVVGLSSVWSSPSDTSAQKSIQTEPARRLQDGSKYVKNIGKAMYGYDEHFGAPLSAEFAGSDPGFQHRPVWKEGYTQDRIATVEDFREVPGVTPLDGKGNGQTGGGSGGGGDDGGYMDYGEGKCLTTGNQEPKHTWKGGVKKADLQKMCDEMPTCHGFSWSTGGSGLLWLDSGLSGGGASWGGCRCYVKSRQSRRLRQIDDTPRAKLVAGPRRLAEDKVKVPDGWKVTLGSSTYCESDFNSKVVKSAFDYEKEQESSSSINIYLGVASFGFSTESTEFRKRNGKEKKMMVVTKAECIDYVAEIEDLQNNPPPSDDSFKFVVEAAETEEEFHKVFDLYGLQFPTKLIFGARYGYTRLIDESNYVSLESESNEKSVTAGVTYSVGQTKGVASAGVDITVEVGLTTGERKETEERVKKYFEEVKEFSVGKRMPDKGGAQAWVNQVGGEPMPIKYEFKSLCEHPAMASKKSRCEQHASTYCENHLQPSSVDSLCAKAPELECLWDLDCDEHHVCSEGACVKEPECSVQVYSESHQRGTRHVYGPVFARQNPVGKVIRLTGGMNRMISSANISAGCEEVIFMNGDDCRESHWKNQVVDLRDANTWKTRDGMDNNDNVCALKVFAKKNWLLVSNELNF